MEHGHTIAEIRERLSKRNDRGDLRDFVLGSIDGTITTFAIVSGVEGAEFSTTVIVALGLANVLADGFSMAAGNYSGTKAEMDDIKRLREVEKRHIRDAPEGEREEVRQILMLKGLKGHVLEEAVDAITSDEKRWIDLMMVEEYGVSPEFRHPMRSGIVTFLAFVLFGLIPLAPYLLKLGDAFSAALFVTGMTFFVIGAFKSKWSSQHWLLSGLETFVIGAIAASLSYFVGSLFS